MPTVLVAIFASLLFQSGIPFWFSDRARRMLEMRRPGRPDELQTTKSNGSPSRPLTASADLADYLATMMTLEDPRFQEAFAQPGLNRNLSEAIIFTYGTDKQIRTLALVDPYDRPFGSDIPPAAIAALNKSPVVPINSSDRIGAVTQARLRPGHVPLCRAGLRPAVSRADRAGQ